MNEKIRELFHQAYGYPIDIVGEQAEKFAELIVRECAELCMKEIDTGLLMAPQAPEMAKQIKQHFGVKE